MTRLLPFPMVSASVLVFWLLLNQSVSPGHILLGAAIALVGGWALSALDPPRAHPRRLGVLFRLAAFVVADIVRSNVAVAGIILGFERRRSPGFVDIPLEL